MKGYKRFRSGAWRVAVFVGVEPDSGRQRYVYETVRAPNNRAGAKAADARLAQLISSVETAAPDLREERHAAVARPDALTVREIAERWQQINRPRQNRRTGDWIGWSPSTARTVADNCRLHILPALGDRDASAVSGLDLDDLYATLEREKGMSPSVVARIHSQIRAMYSWALRKHLVMVNPALSADPPRLKPGKLHIPSMEDVRAVQTVVMPAFGTFVQLAATVGARRGTLLALRWGDVDLDGPSITFTRSLADSGNGTVEKGTKADRPYTVTLGPGTVAVMTAHRQRCIEQALAVGAVFGPESFVFTDDGGLTSWSLSWPSHAWARGCTKAGVKPTRLHDLRHTAASQMLMSGIPISIVAERLGCTEGNILRTYRHFIPGSDREAAVLMDEMLAGTS